MSADEARMAVQQLVHTVQAVEQERVGVVFVVNGRPLDTLLGEPVPAAGLRRATRCRCRRRCGSSTPPRAPRTDGRLQVEGRGAFFEATVSWQVLDAGTGQVVRDGSAMAQECCTLSPYSFTLPRLPDGQYILRVYDADMSGGEGPGEQEDTKSFVIR